MPGASLFPAFNLFYDGHLCERLTEWQAEGLNLDQIADRIMDEKGLRPGSSTLSRWMAGDCRDDQ